MMNNVIALIFGKRVFGCIMGMALLVLGTDDGKLERPEEISLI